MRFPKLSFKDPLMQRAWEALRAYMLQFDFAKAAEKGKDGADGDSGEASNCNEWVDVDVAASPYTLPAEHVNKTVFMTNTSGGSATINLPTSYPGQWLIIVNTSAGSSASYNLSVVPGTGVGLIISGGQGAYLRCDGMGRWIFVSLTGGTPTTRVY